MLKAFQLFPIHAPLQKCIFLQMSQNKKEFATKQWFAILKLWGQFMDNKIVDVSFMCEVK